MATKNQVLDLAVRGMSYEEIGLALGLSPGLAYLIATGVPADGSDALSPEDRQRPGLLDGSTQHLSNPPASAPKSSDTVHRWMEKMANADSQMSVAAQRREVESTGRRSRAHRPSKKTGKGGAKSQAQAKSEKKSESEHGGGAKAQAGKTGDPQPEPQQDVLSVLRREHNEIHSVLQELSSLPGMRDGGSPEELSKRTSLADVVIERLSAHEAAEERLFWPAVADTLDGGPSMAAMARDQEKEGKRVLAELRRLGKDTEQFDELVDQLSDLVRKHVAFEDAVFTKVEEQLSEETRRQLGGRLAQLLERSPTRPHPHTPAGAAALHAVAPAESAADHARDRVSGRPADRHGRAASPSTTES